MTIKIQPILSTWSIPPLDAQTHHLEYCVSNFLIREKKNLPPWMYCPLNAVILSYALLFSYIGKNAHWQNQSFDLCYVCGASFFYLYSP